MAKTVHRNKCSEHALGRSIKEVAAEIHLHPELAFGFALLWAWTRLVFDTSSFDGMPLFAYESRPSAGLVVVLSNALAYLAIGVLFKMKRTVFHVGLYIALVAFAMSAGSALSVASVWLPVALEESLFLSILGSVLVGAGVAFGYVEWGRILGLLGPRRSLAHACCAMLGSSAILVALNAVPFEVQSCYLALAPMAVMTVVASWLKRTPTKLVHYGAGTELHVPWRLLVTAAAIGVAFGLAFEVEGMGDYLDPPLLRNALTLAVSAVLLLLAAVLFKMDFNQLIYRVGIPLAAAGCLGFAVLGRANKWGGFVFSASYLFLDMLIWVLVAYIIKHQKVSANWIVALVTGSLLLGRSAGAFSASFVVGVSSGFYEAQGVVMVVLAYALMLCALLMVNKRNILAGWGSTRPAEVDVEGVMGMACRILGGDKGLTPRETEILALLARGYSRETVSKALTLSKETVRTHAANIFKKLGVHSHQELIMLVEEAAKTLQDG